MNATLSIGRPGSVAAPGRGSGAVIGRLLTALQGLIALLSRRQKALSVAILAGALLIVASVADGPRLAAYLGVFGSSVVTNGMLFLPSGRVVIMVGAALVLNPLAVAVLSGVGGALGEITGYALGRSSRKLVKGTSGPSWLGRWAESNMAITVLPVSTIPNPFVGFIGIVAGRMGYPVRLFLAYSAIGKVVQSIALVYLALWNLSLLSSVTGI